MNEVVKRESQKVDKKGAEHYEDLQKIHQNIKSVYSFLEDDGMPCS